MKTKPNTIGRKLRAAVAILVAAFFLFGAAVPASAAGSPVSATATKTLTPAVAVGSFPQVLPAALVLQAAPASSITLAAGTGSSLQIGMATKPWAEKVKAFTQCIFAVGIPVGVALSLIGNPAAWSFIIGQGAKPLMVSPAMYNYMIWVKQRCSYALF